MKNLLWAGLALLLLSFSCEDQDRPLGSMDSLEKQILQLSESVGCSNSSEWKFAPMGSKACGGPARYIAYHASVEIEILPLIDQFTAQQKQYNQQTGAVSDCSLVAIPNAITCEGGKAVLRY